MSYKREMPKVVSYFKEEEFLRVARGIVRDYNSLVFPILFRFRLLDDEHIKKYLGCRTAKEIYEDAMQENKETMLYLEQEAFFNEEDLWKVIRDESSPVMKPSEEGFVFKKLPYFEYDRRELIIKSLSVENRKIHIDQRILQEASVLIPSPRKIELYNIVSDFCDAIEKGGFSKCNVGQLIYKSQNGKIVPNLYGILGVTVGYKLKK